MSGVLHLEKGKTFRIIPKKLSLRGECTYVLVNIFVTGGHGFYI
jgi:hypothetical protein